MGTEVLRPQDCLGESFRVCKPVFHRRKSSFKNGNGFGNVRNNNYGYRKQLNRPERADKKRKPVAQQKTKTDQQLHNPPPRTTSAAELENHFNRSGNHHHHHHQLQNGVEMGRVMILKRGQSLDSFETKVNKENTNSETKGGIMKNKSNMTGRYGDSLYAGSAFTVSPAPESLPLPSFFNTNSIINNNNNNIKGCEFNDFASRDLRRLLRLE